MKKRIVWTLMVLAFVCGLAWMSGCKSQSGAAPGIPVGPKWKGAPYRISFDAPTGKPALVPTIKYTANPDALERRATMIVRFDAAVVKSDQTVINQIILTPFDVQGAEGKVPADVMAAANKGLADLLAGYRVKGKVKVQVALARSSLSRGAGESEITTKRLSDWAETESEFKGAH